MHRQTRLRNSHGGPKLAKKMQGKKFQFWPEIDPISGRYFGSNFSAKRLLIETRLSPESPVTELSNEHLIAIRGGALSEHLKTTTIEIDRVVVEANEFFHEFLIY